MDTSQRSLLTWPWSASGSNVISGQEARVVDVECVVAAMLHPFEVAVLVVLQLVATVLPELTVWQDTQKFVTVDEEHDDVFDELVDEDLSDDFADEGRGGDDDCGACLGAGLGAGFGAAGLGGAGMMPAGGGIMPRGAGGIPGGGGGIPGGGGIMPAGGGGIMPAGGGGIAIGTTIGTGTTTPLKRMQS